MKPNIQALVFQRIAFEMEFMKHPRYMKDDLDSTGSNEEALILVKPDFSDFKAKDVLKLIEEVFDENKRMYKKFKKYYKPVILLLTKEEAEHYQSCNGWI